MIRDAYFLSAPLRFLVGMIQMFLASAALIGIVFVMLFVWLFDSHDHRAELTKNFATEQAIYRVDLLNNKNMTRMSGTAYDKDTIDNAFTGQGVVKGLNWTQDNWLAGKSDAYERAYVAASDNLSALQAELMDATGLNHTTHFVIPNVPVVEIAFLRQTDEEMRSPANARYNWFTGICEEGHCTEEDFVPRNDSIFYDAIAPQMTDGQAKAIKDLYATGTPEFWIAAAHANGIMNSDASIAAAAAREQAKHGTPTKTLTVDEMIWDSVIGYAILVVIAGIVFTLYAAHRIEETKKTANC